MLARVLVALVLGALLLMGGVAPTFAGVEGGDPSGVGIGGDPGGWGGW